MGKTIEFELDYTLPETGYYCTCCKHTEIDHSGTFYPAADYEALEARVKELEACKEEATRRVIEHAKEARALENKLARLVVAAENVLNLIECLLGDGVIVSTEPPTVKELKAAIEAAKVKP